MARPPGFTVAVGQSVGAHEAWKSQIEMPYCVVATGQTMRSQLQATRGPGFSTRNS